MQALFADGLKAFGIGQRLVLTDLFSLVSKG
jgi:hypothetical protein